MFGKFSYETMFLEKGGEVLKNQNYSFCIDYQYILLDYNGKLKTD